MIIKNNYLLGLVVVLLSSSGHADGFNKKEVYSYQSTGGTPVFTDKRPTKSKQYKTQTIEVTEPNSKESNNSHTITTYNYSTQINNTQTTIYTTQNSSKKKQHNKKFKTGKHSIQRCQRYKEKLDHYSDKMRSGYKNSEYKKLEKNRKKYKNLLFKNCDTKTFRE
ncbi:hypothetical protein [uncultured Cocleimonas sp.]|uniref:hypothetical protein n=1 Tax=uncultured Cocleimonas sp. TaxID=1051587 RepID=UPI0026374E34|nr:hypothetical protein [uncultured Cocleimonas sp.]